jgi:hypothetical protein
VWLFAGTTKFVWVDPRSERRWAKTLSPLSRYRFASGRTGADSSCLDFVAGGGGTGIGNPRNIIMKKTGNSK